MPVAREVEAPKSLPTTPEGVIDMLDALFPDRGPSPSMTDREIWMAVGARRVVDFLLALRDKDETA